jgi:hypothetical protein
MSLWNWLNENSGTLGSIGALAGGFQQAGNLENMGNDAWREMMGLGDYLKDESGFTGYGVTSGFGTSGVGPDGGIYFGLGADPNLQGMAQQYLSSAGGGGAGSAGFRSDTFGEHAGDYHGYAKEAIERSLADPAEREKVFYERMMAAQNPQLDRMQASQMAAEHAMGRGGISGSQYGGTAEDAAMARARTDSSRQAVLGAMDQARSELGMFAQMGSSYGQLGNTQDSIRQSAEAAYNQAKASEYGSRLNYQAQQSMNNIRAAELANTMSYMPAQMQMDLMKLGTENASLAQAGQLTGNDLYGQLALGGLNANMAGQTASSNLTANLYAAMLNNAGSGGSSGNGLFSGIMDLFGG